MPLDPAVKAYQVKLERPTLQEATADAERLLAGLEAQHGLSGLEFDFPVLQTLPGACRDAGWDLEAVVWQGRTIVDVRAAAEKRPVLGLAVDVGTTTIAAYLCDLDSGEILATESAMNPQVAFGDDLIARLHYVTHHDGGLAELQRTVDRRGQQPGRARPSSAAGAARRRHLRRGHGGQHRHAPPVPGPRDPRPRRGAVRAGRPGAGRHPGLRASGLTFNPGCRLHVLPWRPASSAPTTWP